MKYIFSVFFIISSAFQLFGQTWSQLDDYPGLGRDDAVAFAIGDCGYIVTGNHSGFSESNHLWKYNTLMNKWSKMTDFIGEIRQYACSFTHENFAYILGGISENNVPLNDFYRYNSLDDSWKKLASFPGVPRWSAASATNNTSEFVFGGTTLTNTLNDAWRFDFTSETWEELPPVPAIGKRDQICFSLDKKIYLSAGFSIGPTIFHSESFSFNIDTKSWNVELDFPAQALAYLTVANSLTKVVTLGGLKANGFYSDESWLFDGKKWTELSTCLALETKGMSSFCINNKFYFLTGINAEFNRINDFFVLNFNDENEIQIFPNPSEETTNFNAKIGSKLEIYNSLGEKLLNHEFTFSNNFSYAFNKSGIYLTKITFLNEEFQTKKIVIL